MMYKMMINNGTDSLRKVRRSTMGRKKKDVIVRKVESLKS